MDAQKSLNEAFNRRTVRLDVYLDDGKSVYNLEMQTTRHAALPKRARLYQAHMDINQLQRGQFYTKLRPSFVIFICTFDPFDEGRYLYSFRNVCRETGAELGDEAYKLFFNTAGTHGEISASLREILRSMNDPKSYPVEQADLPLIRSIDEAVDKAKMDNEWRHAFMIYQIHQQDAELRGEAPVSYTHLDVYKRQLHIGDHARGIARAILRIEHFYLRVIVKRALAILAHRDFRQVEALAQHARALAGQAPHAEAIRPVGQNFKIHNVVAQAENGLHILAGRVRLGKDQNSLVAAVRIQALGHIEVLAGAEHAARFHAAQLAALDLHPCLLYTSRCV